VQTGVTVRIHEVLSRLERVEEKMAEFYEWLSEVFDGDEEASGLFFRMSLQEKSHSRLLKYGRKLAFRSPDNFAEVDFDSQPVDELLESVNEFRSTTPSPSLAEALFFAMKVECHPAENSHREVLAVSNPEISQMIRNLAIADEEHHRTLKAFAKTRAEVFD